MSQMVEVVGLKKVYRQKGKPAVKALDGIGFSIGRGEVVGLLGPNGAGKTTTIKCLCGLITPTSGGILIDGVDTVKNPKFGMGKISAVLEGNRNVYWRLTPRENLSFFAGMMGIPQRRSAVYIEELLRIFRLKEKERSQARYLSRGMQQKLALACSLVKGTEILLLDEPTLGLDVESSHEMRELIKGLVAETGKTVFLSSHDMKVVEDLCQRVIIINNGKVVTDDTVRGLQQLFMVSSYRFNLEGGLPSEARSRIEREFELSKIVEDGAKSQIDVELSSAERFYDLVDILKRYGCAVGSIDHKEPDFEEIFLKIVRGEDEEVNPL